MWLVLNVRAFWEMCRTDGVDPCIVLAALPVDVACKSLDAPHCSLPLIHILFSQNAKVSVMGAAQLASVMTSVSKYASLDIPSPSQSALVLTNIPRTGTQGNTPRYRVRSRSSRARCTRLRACGTTGLSVPRTRATSWVWGLRSLLARGPWVREGEEARHGMGTRRALECLGCKSDEDICYCKIYAIGAIKAAVPRNGSSNRADA